MLASVFSDGFQINRADQRDQIIVAMGKRGRCLSRSDMLQHQTGDLLWPCPQLAIGDCAPAIQPSHQSG